MNESERTHLKEIAKTSARKVASAGSLLGLIGSDIAHGLSISATRGTAGPRSISTGAIRTSRDQDRGASWTKADSARVRCARRTHPQRTGGPDGADRGEKNAPSKSRGMVHPPEIHGSNGGRAGPYHDFDPSRGLFRRPRRQQGGPTRARGLSRTGARSRDETSPGIR